MKEQESSQQQASSPDLLTVNEASTFLKISESMVRALVLKRKLPIVRIGRCVRFSRKDLNQWLEKKKSYPADV